MQLQEFKFIYDDMKAEIKLIPPLPILLKSIESTTKKLQCINLYSLADRREFDLQLYEKEIYDEMTQLLQQVAKIRQAAQHSQLNGETILQLEEKIDEIKQSKMQAFDRLNKLEEVIQEDLQKLIDEQMFVNPVNMENEIKEVEEDEEEAMEEPFIANSNQQNRIDGLKKEIDEINTKIIRINRGRGKWFEGDHADFIKIYVRCGGDAKKIVEEGVKALGMKNIEIMDHLEVYETYLQLEKEKKLAAEQFKSIKMYEKQVKNQEEMQSQMAKEQRQQLRKKQKEQEQLTRKMQVEQFKRKKAQQREKLVQQITHERENQKKTVKVSLEKKKQIQARNRRIIQQKHQLFKIRNSSSSATKHKPKPSTKIGSSNEIQIKQIPRLLKPPLPEKK